mgnify:CR=1 FL=1
MKRILPILLLLAACGSSETEEQIKTEVESVPVNQETVSDGEFIDSNEMIITVYEVNDPPVLTAIGDQYVEEDNSLDVFLNATDVDNEYLTYAVVDTAGMTVSLSANVLSVTPPLDYNGSVDIVVSVSDGEHFDYTDFTLTVNAVNDASIVCSSLNQKELQLCCSVQ